MYYNNIQYNCILKELVVFYVLFLVGLYWVQHRGVFICHLSRRPETSEDGWKMLSRLPRYQQATRATRSVLFTVLHFSLVLVCSRHRRDLSVPGSGVPVKRTLGRGWVHQLYLCLWGCALSRWTLLSSDLCHSQCQTVHALTLRTSNVVRRG